jgi:multisubunit Na+/H+ antiporter MnhE subunit
MSLWIIVDDSVQPDELLAGAGAAALAAAFAELVTELARTRLRVRARWLWRALRLPGDVARDTGVVFTALGRMILTGEEPASVFRELPVRSGPASAEGRSRRALIIGSMSLAPNTFALGIDTERDVMVVHQLVAEGESESK